MQLQWGAEQTGTSMEKRDTSRLTSLCQEVGLETSAFRGACGGWQRTQLRPFQLPEFEEEVAMDLQAVTQLQALQAFLYHSQM